MKRRLSVLIILFAYCLSSGIASALTAQQRLSVGADTVYYQPGTTACGNTTTPTTNTGSSVFILGDSITVRASTAYKQILQQNGDTVTIDGSSSRSLNSPGIDGNKLSGMAAIAADKTTISQSSVIVMALGTNGDYTAADIDAAVEALRNINPSAKIYWVDTFGLAGSNFGDNSMGPANTSIYAEANSDNYQVISWAKTVDSHVDPTNPNGTQTDDNNYIDNSDGLGVHPTPAGSLALANAVEGAVDSKNGADNTPATTPGITVNDQAAQQQAAEASTNGTNVGYALYDSSGKLLANYNDSFDNYGASITKAMILVAYLNQIGSNTLSSTATNYLTNMIENSDNSSANWVYGQLTNGPKQINQVATDAGMKHFQFNDQADSVYYLGQSQITANDFAKFFSKIDTMFPSAQKTFALGLLSSLASVDQTGILNAGLPGTVYSKEGWKSEPGGAATSDLSRSGSANPFGNEGAPYVVNQAAQFSAGNNTYGVAVTVGGTTDRAAGEDIIQKVVSALVSPANSPTATGQGSCACSPTSSSPGSTVLTGSDNEQKIWNYFSGKGLTNEQVAGVVGNIQDESSFDPEISQAGGDTQTPTTTADVGWGLAQWTPSTDGPNPVTADATQYNIPGPIYEMSTQLDIIWAQMNGTSPTGATDMLAGLKQITDTGNTGADEAAKYFEANFEEGVPATDAGAGNLSGRQAFAETALSDYGNGDSGGGTSTTVGTTTSSGCATATISCNNPSTVTSSLSTVRQNVVCIAQQELALWKSQPGYNSPYPGFKYAATGFLKYSNNQYQEWCADFASWVYNQANYPFSGGEAGGWLLPAVQSIADLGEAGQNFHYHPESSGYVPVPGDLAIHTNGESHVNIFISSSGGTATYIGGDQSGVGEPDGTYGTQSPASGSIVSIETGNGYYDNGITGYVSPD